MIIAEQILCWLVGIALLVLTSRLVHQKRWGFAIAAFVLGVAFCFYGLGLARAWIVSDVNPRLTALGKQIDQVRDTTARIQSELSDHRTALDNHQKELDDQQRRLGCIQIDLIAQADTVSNAVHQGVLLETALISAQRNILAAQERLKDVASTVNQYSDSEDEVFSTLDTNRVVILTPGGVQQVVFRLNYVPLAHTVQAMVTKSHFQAPLLPGMGQTGNVLFAKFFPDADLNGAEFHFRYIKDPRSKLIAQRIAKVDTNAVSIDGAIRVFK